MILFQFHFNGLLFVDWSKEFGLHAVLSNKLFPRSGYKLKNNGKGYMFCRIRGDQQHFVRRDELKVRSLVISFITTYTVARPNLQVIFFLVFRQDSLFRHEQRIGK